MTTTLHRATEPVDFTGRTLEGVAYRYDYPSRVTDDRWASSYFEEIPSGADRRTLSHRASFPLAQMHQSAGGIVIGNVTFSPSAADRALMFTATVDHGRTGDEFLEQLDDWSDASVTFEALRNSKRTTPWHGEIVQRAEIRITELALTPNGTALAKGAGVLAHRAATVLDAPAATKLAEYRARALTL